MWKIPTEVGHSYCSGDTCTLTQKGLHTVLPLITLVAMAARWNPPITDTLPTTTTSHEMLSCPDCAHNQWWVCDLHVALTFYTCTGSRLGFSTCTCSVTSFLISLACPMKHTKHEVSSPKSFENLLMPVVHQVIQRHLIEKKHIHIQDKFRGM